MLKLEYSNVSLRYGNLKYLFQGELTANISEKPAKGLLLHGNTGCGEKVMAGRMEAVFPGMEV